MTGTPCTPPHHAYHAAPRPRPSGSVRRPHGMTQRRVRRLLVLRPGAIGDTLLTVPALHALRRRFPAARIEMAGNPAALPLLASSDLVDRWIPFDDPRITRLFMSAAPAPDDPFVGLDVAVAWCADPDGLLAAGASGSAAPRQVIVTPSRPPPGGRCTSRATCSIRSRRSVSSSDDPLDLPPIRTPRAASAAREELAGARPGGPAFVAIHPGSGSPAKNWPAEQFAAVVDGAAAAHGLPSLVLGGPADAEVLERLGPRCAPSPASLLDRPLLVVAAVLRQAGRSSATTPGRAPGRAARRADAGALRPDRSGRTAPLGPRVRTLRSEPLADLTADRVLAELVAPAGRLADVSR